MGVTITDTHSPYEFDMGYGGFFNLRKNIAFALDKERNKKKFLSLLFSLFKFFRYNNYY